MRYRFFQLFFVVWGLLAAMGLQAQEIIIEDNGIYTGCGATIVDTGGNPSEYGNNEDITYTICPIFPDTVVTLEFLIFSLGEGDVMNIYQGVGTTGPLVGSYSGNDLLGQAISTANDNVTDCITVEFISDADDTGDFAILVSCGFPCERPEAIVEAETPNPVLACVGEELTFDGTGSIFADGTSLQSYEWDFGDGTTDTSSGLEVTHSFSAPGEYVVQLYLTDDNDCSSINLPDVQVLVSTTPSFDGTTDSVNICLGQEVDLTGAVEGVLWDGEPENPIGGYLEIPDDQTQCFSSEITFSNFVPGQTIESADDFESVFVNMEHSYMGDLVISVICPDGSVLITHQQGGGGTYLGNPVDGDGATIVPGEGFDYFWAPDATNGTWEAESFGVSPLPSGTYSSVSSFDDLIGCPMNGIWTLQICDLFGVDNGVVFDWTITFDPSLYPEITQFTPTFGADCDSSAWLDTGANIISTSPDCNGITVAPDEAGTYNYTYEATDNHGCTYSQDAVVTVEQGPIAVAENETVSFCGDPVVIGVDIENLQPGETYIYEWTPADGLTDPNVANPQVVDLTGDQTYTVFVYQPGEEVCGSEATVTVEFIEPIVNEVSAAICDGDTYELPGGEVVLEGGIYSDTLTSPVTGCDSIVVTSLSVNPVFDIDVEASICGGSGYELPDGTVVNESGVYPVSFATPSGCDSTITTNLTVVTVDAGEYDAICPPEYPINLAISGSVSPEDPGATTTWSGPAPLDFGNPNSLNTAVVANEAGVYTIQLTDSRCPDDPASAQLVLRTPPQVNLTTIPPVCVDEDNTIEAQLSGDFAQPPYFWSDEDNVFSGESGTSITIDGDYFADFYTLPVENYLVELTVPGLAPCPPGSDTVSFDVIDCEIIIPNVFTPNGDANNPDFEISGIESYPNSRMIILNRWGKVVYESDDYGEPFWDGTHYKSGAECSDGIYYYELILGRVNEVYKGSVTVLRD